MLNQVSSWVRRLPPVCYWLFPVLWMGLIFAVSSRPTLPEVPNSQVDAVLKKLGHALEYAVLLALWWKPWSGQAGRGRSLLVAWTLTVLYAVSDEYHQTFVSGRTGRGFDVLVDAAGATLATLGIWRQTRSTRATQGEP